MKRHKASPMDAVWQRFVRGVTRAARKEALGRTVVKLAWTAGPVTFLALQGGYFLGYGHSAPAALWYYFGGYTVITGLVAVAIRVAYNATRGEQIEDGRAALAWLLRAFPHLILRTRNENLAYFDENNRRVLAAWELLDNPDAGPHAVEIAIGTLTGSPQLAASAARIETYRRSGLQVLIDDERTHIGEELAAALTELKKWSPQLAELIDRRMHGDAPLASRGRARTAGFIERILSAGEHEDYTLMTFKDAEEAFILALELLAGREFPYLKPEYIGGRTFMEASRSLDRARRAYRAAVYARNGRLRILMELLAETDAVHQVAPTMATLTNLRQNSKAVFVAIDEEVKNLADAAAMNKTRTHVRSRIYNLRKVVELYKQFFRQNELAARRLADLAGAETRYHQAHERSGRHFTPRLLGPKDRGYGIRIRRHTLSPPEEERIDLARQIGSVIPDSFGGIDEIEVKEAAFRTVAELSRRLDLDRWEIQFAIETNNSSYLSYLDPGLTTQTQAGWIISIANDVRWNPIPPLRRLTRILVQYHEMDLDQDSIHRLAEEFEVPPDSLYGVGVVEEPSRKEQAKTFAHLDLPKPDPSWDRTIRRVSGQAR